MKSLNIEIVENGAIIRIQPDDKTDKNGNEIYQTPDIKVIQGNKSKILQELADILK